MKKSLFALLLLLLWVAQGCARSEPTVAQKAARLLIVGVQGQSLSQDNPIVSDIADKGVAGVILFGHNIASDEGSREQLTEFVSSLKSLRKEPLLVSIDQEGGFVNRLKVKSGFKPMPSHRKVGQGDSIYLRDMASLIASEVASVGVNFNFAPCVDVDINPESPAIGHFERSFSADAEHVASCAAAYVEEHRRQGVLTSLKHFPGHGSSLEDSHLGLTDITNTWSGEQELLPYKSLISHGLCDAVMVSHLYNAALDPEYPATLSRKTLQGVLREQLGWSGVVVSDDMQMRAITDHYGFDEAVVLGLNAGVDLFIVGGNITSEEYNVVDRFISIIEVAVESGEVSMQTLDQAVARVDKLLSRL